MALSVSVFAQNKSYFGVRAGINISDIAVSVDDESYSVDSKVNFQLGGAYNIALMKSAPLYLETGLYFAGRSGEIEDIKVNAYQLQIPVLASYHFNVGKFTIEPAAGVYYAFGVAGKVKIPGEDDLKIFKKHDDMQFAKRSDAGLRFAVATTYNERYYLGIGYDLGLMNAASSDFNDYIDAKNGAFFISLGYNF